MRRWFRPRRVDPPQQAEFQGIWLTGNERVAAVGESNYQDAVRDICGSDRWEDVRCEVNAVLVPEPANPYDSNAVMVQVGGELVGYLSRGDALDYQGVVHQLWKLGQVAVCEAMIAGRGPGSETSNLGIFLQLPDPDEAALQILDSWS